MFVIGGPIFILQPTTTGQVVVAAGEEITLNCAATGNPRPVLTWTLDGELIQTGQTLLSLTTAVADSYSIQSTLTIGPVEVTVTGVFQCRAQGFTADGQSATLTSNTTELLFTCKLYLYVIKNP